MNMRVSMNRMMIYICAIRFIETKKLQFASYR